MRATSRGPSNEHAKAGNLNHALQHIDADIIGVLDADHVPTARFLTALLPYFDDPKLAFVQSPQDFYNLESFEHQRRRNGEVFNEEAVFYRVIAPAKNRWSAPFWCGTCALIRVEALRSVGGVSTDSVTEDIHTTIRMYRRGWTGAYHNEVLARGLAPDDASGYLIQRNRWAIGAMQVLRRENPLFVVGSDDRPTPRLRDDALRLVRQLADIRPTSSIPLAVVATGAVPIDAPGEVFVPVFLATLAIQFFALRSAVARPLPADSCRSSSSSSACRPSCRRRWRSSGPTGHRRSRSRPRGAARRAVSASRCPRLLSGLVVASSPGHRLVHRHAPRALAGHVRRAVGGHRRGLLHGVEPRVAARRDPAASDPRSSRGIVGPAPACPSTSRSGWRVCLGNSLDLSVTGAGVRIEAPVDLHVGELWLTMELPTGPLELQVEIRRNRMVGRSEVLGLSFAPGQEKAVGELAVAVFHADVATPRRARRRRSTVVWEGPAPETATSSERATAA